MDGEAMTGSTMGRSASRICSYIYEQIGDAPDNSEQWRTSNFDDYDTLYARGLGGRIGKEQGDGMQLRFWKKMTAHPAYDSRWSEQAMDKSCFRAAADGADDAG